jgi:hypothetical protein
MWQSKREISRECSDIIGSAQILPKAGIKEIILPNADAKFHAVVQCCKIIFSIFVCILSIKRKE